MQTVADRPEAPTAIRTDLGAIFVSLELSRSTWLITALSPGGGEKMSKQVGAWWRCGRATGSFCATSGENAGEDREGLPVRRHSGGGLDSFWIDRALQNEGIESHVVDPASIATSRRHRRPKTDGIDGEALVRALLAYKRGEPRVCAMVKAPTPEEEDRRRLCREQGADCRAGPARQSRQGAVCCSHRGYLATSRCAATGGNGWIRSRPAMVAGCRIT